jgi:hypothetical protein
MLQFSSILPFLRANALYFSMNNTLLDYIHGSRTSLHFATFTKSVDDLLLPVQCSTAVFSE